ncbi:ribonuclease HII, partial [Nanoarchaeota archaeon]
MVLLGGVEEAGRGPVIGPLVMCGVVIKEEDEHKLVTIGTKDSKLLTPQTRERIFDQVIHLVEQHEIIILQPQDVDDSLNDPNMNLNWLEAVTSAKIINKLKLDKVILDCPSNNPPAYKNYIMNHIENKNLDVLCEHKADLNYTVVAAASIIAKVTRDR